MYRFKEKESLVFNYVVENLALHVCRPFNFGIK